MEFIPVLPLFFTFAYGLQSNKPYYQSKNGTPGKNKKEPGTNQMKPQLRDFFECSVYLQQNKNLNSKFKI